MVGGLRFSMTVNLYINVASLLDGGPKCDTQVFFGDRFVFDSRERISAQDDRISHSSANPDGFVVAHNFEWFNHAASTADIPGLENLPRNRLFIVQIRLSFSQTEVGFVYG